MKTSSWNPPAPGTTGAPASESFSLRKQLTLDALGQPSVTLGPVLIAYLAQQRIRAETPFTIQDDQGETVAGYNGRDVTGHPDFLSLLWQIGRVSEQEFKRGAGYALDTVEEALDQSTRTSGETGDTLTSSS